jgi:hypothetical protein
MANQIAAATCRKTSIVQSPLENVANRNRADENGVSGISSALRANSGQRTAQTEKEDHQAKYNKTSAAARTVILVHHNRWRDTAKASN